VCERSTISPAGKATPVGGAFEHAVTNVTRNDNTIIFCIQEAYSMRAAVTFRAPLQTELDSVY
jgi:hypothetical protein